MVSSEGRIPKAVLTTVSGLLFGIAIAAAFLSTIARVRHRNGIGYDDLFLLLACVFLIASTALLYDVAPALYFEEALTLDPISVTFGPDSIAELEWYQKVAYAFLDISTASVYAVKFSFLFFFRALIDRLRGMILYWRVVLGITATAFAFSVSAPFIGCSGFGLDLSCLDHNTFVRTIAMSSTTSCLDIATDVLIIAIPTRLLWQVKIKPRQKLILGATLCLSVFMIITCIIQVAGLTLTGSGNALGGSGESFDGGWQVFWQQVEACIAVTVISFTSFRSLFVGSNPASGRGKLYQWYSSRRSKASRSKGSKESRETTGQRSQEKIQKREKSLPSIPLDTLKSTSSGYGGLQSADSGYGGLNSADESGLGPARKSATNTTRQHPADSERVSVDDGMATIALKPPSDEDVSPLSTDSRSLPLRHLSDEGSMQTEAEGFDWRRNRLSDEEMLIEYPLANRAQPTQPYYNMSFDTDSIGRRSE
ncbi:hypothetical protein MMC13_005473 [Lambiella insularis]|nr:hypothetical protein [Lambiella insularis]